jgi:hypothetical protein
MSSTSPGGPSPPPPGPPPSHGERPTIDSKILRRWPTPPEVPEDQWASWSLGQRETWLIDHTFTESDGRWTARASTQQTGTSQQVVEAVSLIPTATEAAVTLFDGTVRDFGLELADSGTPGRDEHVHAVVVVLALIAIVLVALVVAAFVLDWFGSDGSSPLADHPVMADDPEPTDVPDGVGLDDRPPAHEELEAQEDVELASVRWRFFRDPSEASPLYDFEFGEEGVCRVPGDTIIHACAYDVDGSSIEITINRSTEVTARNAAGAEWAAVVDWVEWFHMSRAGNALNGSWESEDWTFSYDDGLVRTGRSTHWTEVFARPIRPDVP